MNQGNLIVLSAPSGGGKSTLIRELRKKLPDLCYSVSVTTRPPRKQEKHARDYFFITEKEFEQKKDSNQLVEWACVHGYWYGTPRTLIEKSLKAGKDVLLDIDVQGGEKIRSLFPDAVLIFIAPPSLEILESRLRERGQDDEATIQRRFRAASREMDAAAGYDYLVTNDEIRRAVEDLRCILVAERLRTRRAGRSALERVTI